MDRIVLEGIAVWAHHGLRDVEREVGQRFVVDAALELDLAAAAISDDPADTVDYGPLAERIAAAVTGQRCDLIEAVAGRVLDVCLADERVSAAEVTVHKPDAPLPVSAEEVRVQLRRER